MVETKYVPVKRKDMGDIMWFMEKGEIPIGETFYGYDGQAYFKFKNKEEAKKAEKKIKEVV